MKGLDGSPDAEAAAAVLRIQLMEANPVVGERMSGVLGIGPGRERRWPLLGTVAEDGDAALLLPPAAPPPLVALNTPR